MANPPTWAPSERERGTTASRSAVQKEDCVSPGEPTQVRKGTSSSRCGQRAAHREPSSPSPTGLCRPAPRAAGALPVAAEGSGSELEPVQARYSAKAARTSRASMLGLPDGLLMEEYLRRFSMAGGRAPRLAWLDCGSGGDGYAGPWELGPDGSNGLSRQRRGAARFRVAEAVAGRPGEAPEGWRRWADKAFPPLSRGGSCSARRSARPRAPGGRRGPQLPAPVPALGRRARRHAGEPATHATPRLRRDPHLRVGERRGAGQHAAGSSP